MNKPAKTSFPSAQKFQTVSDILVRLETLRSQKFEKGQRGIGQRDKEVKLLEERLSEIQNPPLL